jgi:hypothetical protein
MAALKDFSVKIFGGSIKADMSLDLKHIKPEVGTKVVVSEIQTQKMVESQIPIAKNTVRGIMSANLDLAGSGLNQSDINSSWKGNAAMHIDHAVLTTLDIGKQVKDGVLAKLPEMAKQKAKIPASIGDWKGEYEKLSMKFELKSGIMNISEVLGKAYPAKGLDAHGGGTIKLENYGLDLNLDIVDQYNLLNGDAIAKDPKYGHMSMGLHLTGSILSPRYDWGYTVRKIAENAVRQHGAQVVTKVAEKYLGDKVPGGTANAVNQLIGGLGRSGGRPGSGRS